MIVKEFKKTEVNVIFKKLKTRQFVINTLGANRPDESIICENLNVE
jgi:hypothetical protein